MLQSQSKNIVVVELEYIFPGNPTPGIRAIYSSTLFFSISCLINGGSLGSELFEGIQIETPLDISDS